MRKLEGGWQVDEMSKGIKRYTLRVLKQISHRIQCIVWEL